MSRVLCLDIGNTNIFGGILDDREVLFSFRCPTSEAMTSDTFGVFLISVIERKGIDPESIEGAAYCSVVPSRDHAILNACRDYLSLNPVILGPENQRYLFIESETPGALGADRVANALGGLSKYPEENLIIVDMGTATTFCVIDKNWIYKGGSIMPGLRLSMEALATSTAKLGAVPLEKPSTPMGTTTSSQVQSGLYFGHVGAIREHVRHLQDQMFSKQPALVLLTGGLSHFVAHQEMIHVTDPHLVFSGLSYFYHRT